MRTPPSPPRLDDTASETAHANAAHPLHWPSLTAALLIMLVGTLYPPLLTRATGQADHGLATLVFLAMTAGFVRGVGFVPRLWPWRVLFSGWTCALALTLAIGLKWLH